VTFGGLEMGLPMKWKWPKRKRQLARFRKICGLFRATFLAGLKQLMDEGKVVYHRSFEDLEKDLLKKQWVVNHQWPTADTKVIEEYPVRFATGQVWVAISAGSGLAINASTTIHKTRRSASNTMITPGSKREKQPQRSIATCRR